MPFLFFHTACRLLRSISGSLTIKDLRHKENHNSLPDGVPNANELAGPQPRSLDGEAMLKNFLGKTADDAFRMFVSQTPISFDFTYMLPAGLMYYLPAALRYLEAEESTGDWEFAHQLLCSLFCQVTIPGITEPSVLQLINAIANYCDLHRAKFDLTDDDLVDEYLAGIRGPV